MRPSKLRRSREELQKEAEANFRYYGPSRGIDPFTGDSVDEDETDRNNVRDACKPRLPCHVPNCNDPHCDRFHEGDDQ